MLKQALIIAFRNIGKYKLNFLINLLGMTYGISAVIVIASYVFIESKIGNELSPCNIYRIEVETSSNIGTKPVANYPTAKFLLDKLPEIKNACLVNKQEIEIIHDNQSFLLNEFIRTDSSFFQFYPARLLKGSLEDFNKIPFPLVLSNSLAYKIFGDQNPIGEELKTKEFSMTVIAVMEDVPSGYLNQFEAVVNERGSRTPKQMNLWTWFNYMFLLELEEKSNPEYVANVLNEKLKKVHPYAYNKHGFRHRLTAYEDIYFDNSITQDVFRKGNRKFFIFFSTVAIFILLIAIINSVNLTRAQWMGRLREMNVRKSFGASMRNLYFQFIGEVLLWMLLCFVFSLPVIYTILPSLFDLEIISDLLNSNKLIYISFFAFVLVGALVALLASIGIIAKDSGASVKRCKAYLVNSKMFLLGFQFVVSIVLITSILGINKQVDFMRFQDVGFKKENLLEFKINGFESYESLRNELLKHAAISEVSFTDGVINPSIHNITHQLSYDGKQFKKTFPIMSADEHFPEIMGLKIIQGETFGTNPNTVECMMNHTAAKLFEIEDLNKGVQINKIPVVGVFEDYNFRSLHQEIGPLVVFKNANQFMRKEKIYDRCLVKIGSNHSKSMKTVISYIENTWKKLSLQKLDDIHFVDDSIDAMYQKERNFQKILNVFAFLSLCITLMGLFGVSLSMLGKRTKEIGVRKVNGASVFEIYKMLNIDFLKWVFLAFILSIPISYYVLDLWLAGFAYKTKLDWWIFSLAGIIALFITMISISWQTTRAVRKNPVEILRDE